MTKGKFITVEGTEGVGKSSCMQFIAAWLQQHNVPYCLTREPGGTALGEAMREVLLAHADVTIADDAELLMMFAARAQHLAEVIRPALDQGQWVVSDRFTDASFAYQGGGRGIDKPRITELEAWVQAGLQPDLTLLLDAPLEIARARADKRSQADRIEAESDAFFTRVRNCYLQRAEQYPQRFKIIDASVAIDSVQQQIITALDEFSACQTSTPGS